MSWFDALPLVYSEPNTRNALALLQRVYRDTESLEMITKLAGLNDALIDFHVAPALLPMKIMDLAANEKRMPQLLAEVLADAAVAAIHDDLWKLLGADASRVHAAALATNPSFDRRAVLPSPSTYAVNGSNGDLQKIVNALAKFQNSAVFRFELAQREARIVRIDVAGQGMGTGWLVGPEHILTAYHVISNAANAWESVKARLDYKIVPDLGRQVLEPGRLVKLAEKPLLAYSNHAGNAVELSQAGPDPSLLDFALLRLSESVGNQGLAPDGRGEEKRGWYELPSTPHAFDPNEGLFVLGHPMLQGESEAGPLKLTLALPSGAGLTDKACRVRYSVNTEGGNSGSPVMDQDFRPLALHHFGLRGKPEWDSSGQWAGGFNQGIPLHLIVAEIRKQVTADTIAALNLT